MVECDSRCRILWFTLLQIGRNKEVTESSDAHVTTFNLDVGNFSWHTPPVNHYYLPPFETFTRVTHTTIWFNRFLILLCSFSCLHIFIVATKECFAQWVCLFVCLCGRQSFFGHRSRMIALSYKEIAHACALSPSNGSAGYCLAACTYCTQYRLFPQGVAFISYFLS